MVASTEETGSAPRRVLVLGRSAGFDAGLLREALDGASSLLVLSLGFPPTEAQRHVLADLTGIVEAAQIVVTEALVFGRDRLAGLLRPDDAVRVDAGPRERRRIARAMPKGGEPWPT